ncbi:hypothetical protein RND81_08G032300 [Saponaria officinalis]|uniref:Peptidase C14 caspase domain-containing protein n=1 Tax=Saponaria officinalis TaxID=3572 RepID=A0AAW1J2S8_SAPOF
MGKKAVLIGINYPGTKAELKGCINDVRRMRTCLMQSYGFEDQNINVLIDTDPSYTQPTGKNIRRALDDLVRSAVAGDELYVHYSGHGTRLPAETGDIDNTGYDECIVPSDMNLITDDDFKELVSEVDDGCRITIVSDSCHSGGLISGVKEQIGESTQPGHRTTSSPASRISVVKDTVIDAFEPQHSLIDEDVYEGNRGYVKSRLLPLSTLIDMLKEKTGKDDIDVGRLRPTLLDIFGDDASPKVKKFMKVESHGEDVKKGSCSCLGGILSTIGDLVTSFSKKKSENNDDDYTKLASEPKEAETTAEQVQQGAKTNRVLPRNGILLSGCQTDETSADANPTGNPKEAYGAFSNAILSILKENKGNVSNHDIVSKARKLLKRQGFTQRPGLYCSDDYVKAPFVY